MFFPIKDGHSALSVAAKNGYTEVVLKLIEKGAYVNTSNKVNFQFLFQFLNNK